ncbi:alpha/beta fold hydrolase [Thalassococcus lentus]|uniref:Alpha/beta fold hydrolase n=1 Tax=Thalassococcus lentus TaxID=1210524 RepID=A0ABT4XQS2_9RHOB|nr:alpha/beta fold hydrolase [Thalassococcus lentus]MDA7424290.1 alpha/beta fold hydrolase [Thalassococcus lentus]
MIPVVFVHGFMGGSKQWAAQQDAFEGAPMVTVDLPGFGDNAHLKPLSSIDAYAAWVLQELKDQGITRFHLVGHSMGGMIAQDMVAQAPNRVVQLVLYGTGAQGVLPGRFETIETSKQRALADGATATARRISATWFLERDKSLAYNACAQIAERSHIDAILSGLDAMNQWNGTENLPTLEAHTLVVWGDHDRTYPWSQTEQLWRTLPNASLAVIPNCAHSPHMEKPELFNTVLSDFFAA